MNRNEKLALLNGWSTAFDKITSEYEKLRDIFELSPESHMSKVMYGTFDRYTRAVALLVGDDSEWLEWYVWENDNGKGRLTAKASSFDERKTIRSTEDLLDLIEG